MQNYSCKFFAHRDLIDLKNRRLPALTQFSASKFISRRISDLRRPRPPVFAGECRRVIQRECFPVAAERRVKCEGGAKYPRALGAETIEKEGMCGVETIKKERKRGASVILIHYKSTVSDGSIVS